MLNNSRSSLTKGKIPHDTLVRAKVQFEGDNVTRPQKPHRESMLVCLSLCSHAANVFEQPKAEHCFPFLHDFSIYKTIFQRISQYHPIPFIPDDVLAHDDLLQLSLLQTSRIRQRFWFHSRLLLVERSNIHRARVEAKS